MVISTKMMERGHTFSREQCRLKYRYLKLRYEKQKKKKKTSDESPVSEDDIFCMLDDQADMNPTHAVDTQHVIETIQKQQDNSDKDDGQANKMKTDKKVKSKKRKRVAEEMKQS